MMIHMIMIMALILHTKNQILLMMIILIMMMALTVIFCPAFGGRSLKKVSLGLPSIFQCRPKPTRAISRGLQVACRNTVYL